MPALAIHELLAQLEIEGHALCPELPWLTESVTDTKQFWAALMEYHSKWLSAPAKTVAFENYDFYFDFVTRNLESQRPAFRWYDDEERKWESFSFAELNLICGRRAKEWEGHGISSGQTVAIVHPTLGPEAVVALLTALKLGAVVSLVPPVGKRLLAKRLEALAPDHIATDRIYEALLGDMKAKAIPDLPPATESHEGSFTYATGAVVAKLFSTRGPSTTVPVELKSDVAYLWPVRDGPLAFSLRPGDSLAAPGVPLLDAHPALLFATLATGSTYVHVELEQVKKNPGLLDSPIKTVGITRELRDVLLDAGARIGKQWKNWFRFADEPGDMVQWFSLVAAAGLEGAFASQVVLDPSLGGCVLFSAKRKLTKGGVTNLTLPSPGTAWFLGTLNGSGMPTLGDVGYLSLKRPGDEKPLTGLHVVHVMRHEVLFVGPQEPRRRGRTYPSEEVLAAVDDLPFALEASVVAVPTGNEERPHGFALAIFSGAETRDEYAKRGDEWRALVEETIERDVGAGAMPDAIEFFPFYARRKGGLTDHDWCRGQYLAGNLHRRSREEPYTLISELRALVLGWEPPKADEPPSDAPPADAPPPEEAPPPETPPPETPPETPPSETPPETPPSETPPETPPSETPPSETPPETPPTETPPDAAPTELVPPEIMAETAAAAAEAPAAEAPPAETPAEPSAEAPPVAEAPPPESSSEAPPPEPSSEAPPPEPSVEAPPAEPPADAPPSDTPDTAPPEPPSEPPSEAAGGSEDTAPHG